ncbi:MAG: hypothetical protein H7328_07915 [Bdellovibrio sp.]|nr:hypothetical protein [Bdellovibrio sp.]
MWFDNPSPTARIAEVFLRFSPQISIRKDRAIFIEIGKCRNLYSEQSFLARAQIILKRQNQTARIGLGSDITDSLAFAKFDCLTLEELPLEAIFDFIDPFERDQALRKATGKLVDSFTDLGIKTLSDFKKIPASQLISRFGVIGRHAHSRVHMQDFISWPFWTPEEIVSEKKEFAHGFYPDLEPILFELKTQLDRIFEIIFSRKKRVTKLQIQIKCEKISTHVDFLRTYSFDFFAPQSSAKGALRIIKDRLAKDLEKKPLLSPVEMLETSIIKLVPFEGGQKNIFNSDEEKFEQINSVHNQLIELLGKENVFQAELTEDRRPERSWKKKHGTPHEANGSAVELLNEIPERATYLCKYPMKIEVTAGYVHIKKRRFKILHWDNQIEKITGGWYEKPTEEIKNVFNRNYSQVEIEGNQKISIFETPNREFYLHGYYG